VDSASSDKYSKDKKKSEFTKNDLLLLTKARLSFLVIVTAVVGFIVAAKSTENSTDWWLLFHTVIGCAFAAAASSIFNQLMEIDIDAKMSRTSDRPLPAKKNQASICFWSGLGFCSHWSGALSG
jgi:heme O synthase-like polyprenyltransferase